MKTIYEDVTYSPIAKIERKQKFSSISDFQKDVLVFFKYLYYFGIFSPLTETRKWKIHSAFIKVFACLLPLVAAFHKLYIAENLEIVIKASTYFLHVLSFTLDCWIFDAKKQEILEILKMFEKIQTQDENGTVKKAAQTATKYGKILLAINLVIITISNINVVLFRSKLLFTVFIPIKSLWMIKLGLVIESVQVIIMAISKLNFKCIIFSLIYLLDAHLKCVSIKLERIESPKNRRGEAKNNKQLMNIIEYHGELVK